MGYLRLVSLLFLGQSYNVGNIAIISYNYLVKTNLIVQNHVLTNRVVTILCITKLVLTNMNPSL